MKGLTKPQQDAFDQIAEAKLNETWKRRGYPGVPQESIDGRALLALDRRGLIEIVAHKYCAYDGGDERTALCVVLTEAGRNFRNS